MGKTLKLLKEKDTFVMRTFCRYTLPNSKSYFIHLMQYNTLNRTTSGFAIKAIPLNSLPATICFCTKFCLCISLTF